MADEQDPPTPPAPRQKAVALEYREKDRAPRVLASGAGEVAKRILELAREHDIPISEDATLTDMLSQLQVGSTISPESYRLVAEIISFLYHTDKRWRELRPDLEQVMGPPVTEQTNEEQAIEDPLIEKEESE